MVMLVVNGNSNSPNKVSNDLFLSYPARSLEILEILDLFSNIRRLASLDFLTQSLMVHNESELEFQGWGGLGLSKLSKRGT